MISFPTVNIDKSYIYIQLVFWNFTIDQLKIRLLFSTHTPFDIRKIKDSIFFHISDTEYFFFDNIYEYFMNDLLIYKI